jgi:retron-type reverse transcriptase
MIEEYLYNRKQVVLYKNQFSEASKIHSGTPQGGVGSPDLFNINVRKLPTVTKFSKLMQFADDNCLLKPIYNVNDINELQSDLTDVHSFCKSKNLELNPEKSVHMRFTFKEVKIYRIIK